MRSIGFVAVAMPLLASAAQSATLTPVQGQVLLNTGGGYKPVTQAVTVKGGDSILVNPDGLAQLSYDHCATFEIKPSNVTYVAEKDTIPCGATAVDEAGGLGANGLLVGGLAVAIGVGVVVGVSSRSDSPSSP